MLSLNSRLNDLWVERLLAIENPVVLKDFQSFCVSFYESFVVDRLLVELSVRVGFDLDQNVSETAWLVAKRAQNRRAKRLGGIFCLRFGCSPVLGQRFAWAFLTALSGAHQVGFKKSLNDSVPEDVQKMSSIMSFQNVFLNIALLLKPNQGCKRFTEGEFEKIENWEVKNV